MTAHPHDIDYPSPPQRTEALEALLLERAKGVCYVSNTLTRGPTLTVRRVDPAGA